MADAGALFLSLKLAGLTTLVLLLLGLPLAWWLARNRHPVRALIEAVVALPLVLPPTVLGFYLLVAFSPTGSVGHWIAALGGPPLVFSFTGLVVGSCLYSLPFMVQPLQTQFAALDRRSLEAAATLGAAPLDRFFSVILPQSRGGLLTACVLTFAHTLGEFGVVLMIGGNIPGQTRVASIAIFDQVEGLNYAAANHLSLILLGVSFGLLLAVYLLKRRWSEAMS
ncbi:molybdate ABC transporter permease subunit [Mangrovitalea sediminis]|uniref:molybdate ABC transporter permease subunit n=1 Tax=Mangrovitalea sediminis TaxID=1982043 RepID=UPI000BE580B3|nr:molybdate ABC transporter permease subunit [Mangrovitalea sediminis]